MSVQIVHVKKHKLTKEIIWILCGNLVMIAFSQIRFPIGPVPITGQTLGLMLVALNLGPKRSAITMGLYLLEATCALPVLAGLKSNPFWFLGPMAGYLISFPPAAYLLGVLSQKFTSKGILFLSMVFVQSFILVIGFFRLSFTLGAEKALLVGVLPFSLPLLIKTLISLGVQDGIEKFISRS